MNNFQRILDNPHLLFYYNKIIVLDTQDDGYHGNRKRQNILYAKTNAKYIFSEKNILFWFGFGLMFNISVNSY